MAAAQEADRFHQKGNRAVSRTPAGEAGGKTHVSQSVVEHWLTNQVGVDCHTSSGGDNNAGLADSRWPSSPLAPVLLSPSHGLVHLRDLKDLKRCSSSPSRACPRGLFDGRPGSSPWMGHKSEPPPMSPGLSRPGSRSGPSGDLAERQHTGLSEATRRENLKKEQYELQLDQAHHGADKKRGGGLDHLNNPNEVAEALGLIKPEEFFQETSNLDHRIEDMSRSVRLDHLGDAKTEERARQLRDEARRQKEAELRRARKREQEARNPQRKVALRLENKRRFENEMGEDTDIPMMRMEIHNNNSRSAVSLVDVRMLRSRCKMLDEGGPCNVRDMLNRDKQKETWQRMISQDRLMSGLRSAASAPVLAQGTPPAHGETTFEQRRKSAVARSQAQHVDNILRKLSNCRNKLPYKLPYRFDIRKSESSANQRLTIAPPLGGPSGREAQVASVLAVRFGSKSSGSYLNAEAKDFEPQRNHSAEVQKLMGEFGRASVVQHERSDKARHRRQSAKRRSEADTSGKVVVARARLRRLFAAVKATVKVLMLHAHGVRRQRAVELVKSILRQLGEWARVRRSIRQLVGSIRVLQVTCRRYQEYKRRRCEQLQREWLKIEDHHLSSYFRTFTQKTIREMREQADKDKPMSQERRNSIAKLARLRNGSKPPVTKKGDLIQMIEDGVQTGNLMVDWKSYRIPPRDRWAIINAFYLNRLKKHVRSKGTFLATVKARVDNEKEMVHFLKTFGADETAVRDFQASGIPTHEVTPPSFWHLSEEICLRLIALAAQSLVSEKPFMDHPANKDARPELTKIRLSIPDDPESVQSGRAAAIRAKELLRRLERPEWTVSLGRLRWQKKKQDQRPEPIVMTEVVKRNSRLSIEEVFRGFTPRLREIASADGQATKSRASARKDGADKDVGGIEIDI